MNLTPEIVARGKKIDSLLRGGFTQSEAADMLGVHRQTVANWVSARKTMADYVPPVQEVPKPSRSKQGGSVAIVPPDSVDTYGRSDIEASKQVDVELECYRRLRFEKVFETGHDKSYHLIKAIRLGLPEVTKKGRGFVMSPWDEQRIRTWCNDSYQTWWGATSTGKTQTAAAILLVHYLSMPERTTINVCSTSMKMTMRRILGKIRGVIRMWDRQAVLDGREKAPLKFSRQEGKLAYVDPETDDQDEEAGIFGIPIVKGAEEEAVNRIIGTHNTAVCLVMDELQGIGEAVLSAWTNLSKGTEEAKFLGMGNPYSRWDSLGIASEPVDGWESINVNSDFWRTRMGMCYRFDGLKSPAIQDPERYPYYLTAKQIEEERKQGNEDTPRWWQMIRGFMPPEGLVQTLITQTLIDKHNMTQQVQWKSPPVKLVALDEAFSIDGDRCMLVTADVGVATDGKVVVQFGQNISLPLKLTESGEIIEYYIFRKTKELCDSMDVPPENFGMDITASQVGFAAIFLKEWSSQIYQCQFGGGASDRPFSDNDPRPSNQVYANRVTELWYTFRRFALAGQIRGMSMAACKEACDRRLINDKDKRIRIEGKADIKSRSSYSPDIMDGHVIITAMCMERFGMAPGTSDFGDMKAANPEQEEAEQIALQHAEAAMYSNEQTQSGEDSWLNDPMFQ